LTPKDVLLYYFHVEDNDIKTNGRNDEMAHIKVSATRAESTPPEWLATGAQIGELVNTWSGRSDIIAYVGEGAGGIAPACFNPPLAEVEVNTKVAFGGATTPAMVGDLRERKQQFEFPKAIGAILHEAFHAKFSIFDMESAYKALAKDEYEALILLEEGRIETQGLWHMPESLNFLRACAMELVIADAKEMEASTSTTQTCASAVGLVLARVDAGIVDAHEVANVEKEVSAFLGEEVISKLREISKNFRETIIDFPTQAETHLYPLAKEWAKIIRDVKEEKGEKDEQMAQAFAQMMMEAISEASEEMEVSTGMALADQQMSEEMAEEAKSKANQAKEENENKDVSEKVFSKSTTETGGSTNSTLVEVRKPTSAERIAAVTISKMLEKAKYRDRDAIEISSIIPPGRLRSRAIVQNAAMKSRGIVQQTEAWRRTVRKQTDETSLTVGVMVDISGSMGSAMKPMATTAWVMSEAVRRVQGRCAMVYYGSDVFPTLKAGQHLEEVRVYSAMDNTEKFDKAFRALDGALNLLNGSGARLLVIVSDGQYTGEERGKARHWTKRCAESGVAVLWLPFDSGHYAKSLLESSAGVVMSGVLDPVSASVEIGKTAERVLTNVGMR
jgi:hypothetical protein